MNDYEKSEFYNFISLDMEQVDVASISEENAIRYFIHSATEEEKELFLTNFTTYIQKYLKNPSRVFTKDKNLLFEAFYLYDNHFPILSLFPNDQVTDKFKSSAFYNKIYYEVADLYDSKTLNKKDASYEENVNLMRKIREYRKDRDFLKRKATFLKEYGQVDPKVLKSAYVFYIAKNNSPDQDFFSPNINTDEDRYDSYSIFRYAYTYALKVLGLSRKEMDKLFHSLSCPSKSQLLYDFCAIPDLSDTVAVKDFIVNWGSTPMDYLRLSLSLYKDSNHMTDLKELFDKAQDSLDEDLISVRERTEKIRQARIMKSVNIQAFLDSDCRSVSEYCKQKGISTYLFSQALSWSSEDVKRQVAEKKKTNISRSYAIVASKIRAITDQIMNGVLLEDNTVREFDYLDYRLATNLSNEEFKKIARNVLSAEEMRVVHRFLGPNKSNGYINVKQELSGSRVFNMNGVLHEVTEEEKIATMDFLKKNNLAHNGIERKLYSVALRRCVQGTLFEEHKDKVPQKILGT